LRAGDDLPGVLESAGIGVTHPDFEESPVAIVVPDKQGVGVADLRAALAGLFCGENKCGVQ
jgi:acyl-coenzyme A synthetase/AMP-(fatty) acid ligase